MEAATEKALTDTSVVLAKDVNAQQLNDQQVQQSQQAPALKEIVSSPAAPLFSSLTVDTLMEAADKSVEEPDEKTQDKILFIINNLSFDNLELKQPELATILREHHFRWFSNYIVIKRASIEANFHSLYIALLDGIASPVLNKNILAFTLQNCTVLLNSEKTVQSSSERTLLKNLGTWLGALTLAKNKPIKHKNLAFKVRNSLQIIS